MAEVLVPAAQYLRMSTDHQKYSLMNQSAAIGDYAAAHGFSIVRTYTDAGKTGLVLKRRQGLKQLLRDVVAGNCGFHAVLVYDVSRWGRFQDLDEAAHYEYLCKAAGVPVHYCAETFSNDMSLPALIMKALKRTMAGEYSRELSVKVLAGQKRLAQLGYKQGGLPGYGLRRLLVDAERRPKQLLVSGEWKSVATDRVILVPGPAEEVAVVREIFRMLIEDGKSVHRIASELNRAGIEYLCGRKWSHGAVNTILTHPKYVGCGVYGRTCHKLSTPPVKVPRADWVAIPGAFASVVSQATFDHAQRILSLRTHRKSDEELLQQLRDLLTQKGRISHSLLLSSSLTPSYGAYRSRFGSLKTAYSRIGYGKPEDFAGIDLRSRINAIREELLTAIVALDPEGISKIQANGRARACLRFANGCRLSVIAARSFLTDAGRVRWDIRLCEGESQNMTLLARMDRCNKVVQEMRVFPRSNRFGRFVISEEDEWLKQGMVLPCLEALGSVIERAA